MDPEKIESPEDTRLPIADHGFDDSTKVQMEATDNEDEKNKEKHRESIDRIFVSQYINDTDNEAYVVTYSKENNSVLGWYVNIEKNKHIQPKSDVYFQLEDGDNYCLIDLNSNPLSNRYLELKCPYSLTEYNYVPPKQDIGFLPNGDLIQVTIKDRKICKFCFTNKPNKTVSWEYSHIYDIEIHDLSGCLICQSKLFLFLRNSETLILQFNLSTMTLDNQYNILDTQPLRYTFQAIANKNQTLWATDIFSENLYYHEVPVKFITLKYGLEGLIVKVLKENKYRLIDPYQPSNVIDITGDIGNMNDFNKKNVITKLNKKVSIDNNNNVCVTDWLDESRLQQLTNISNKIDQDSSIYSFSTLKFIQEMLKDIIEKGIDRVIPEGGVRIEHEVNEKEWFLERYEYEDHIKVSKHGDRGTSYIFNLRSYILSFKLLNNRYLVLIKGSGINIYNIEDMRCQYIWSNNEWNDIREKIENILYFEQIDNNDIKLINYHFKKLLDNEFNDYRSSIPLSKLLKLWNENDTTFGWENIFKPMVIKIINDRKLFIKFGSEILKITIKKNYDDIVQQIIDKIIESITSNSGDYKNTLLPFISLNLPELCQNCYSDFLIKYMAYTSIMLSPNCNSISSSRDTSLNSYLNNCIIKSHLGSNYFKSISSLYDRYLNKSQKETRTISLIVPFPQIFCEYQDDTDTTILKKMITGLKTIMMVPKKNNIWNEFLYKPKKILFCNIDSNNLYNWWNFAAIIDFKWKTFGWIYYSFIWVIYTIFYICYTLASTALSIADFYRGSLYKITIIFGIIQLSFEIRQCLWRPKKYFTDLWNLFDVGAYSLPVIISLYWFISKNPPHWLMAISFILLSFKFLLFFRVFSSFGKYFAIIIGVAQTVFPFLVVLFFIILGFAQAFFIILRSIEVNDDNDPQNLVTKYDFVNSDGTINNIIQPSDSNTNLFNWFPTSLLAVYKMLTVRKLINAIDNNKADFNYPPFISNELRSLVAIKDKYREEKLNETKNELINELKKHIQEVLENNAKKDKANANDEVVEKKENDDQIDE
ncbi:11477_t:CDS:2 [Rhizophagus irregularis]|nr:11477_t:CDS:2 [Rhizophagus irregularis]